MIATAPEDDEAVLVVECDLDSVERVRRDWPFLRDRRIDAYQGLQSRFLDEPLPLAQAEEERAADPTGTSGGNED